MGSVNYPIPQQSRNWIRRMLLMAENKTLPSYLRQNKDFQWDKKNCVLCSGPVDSKMRAQKLLSSEIFEVWDKDT